MPSVPVARYGTPSRTGRILLLAFVAALVVGFLGWLTWAIIGNADPAVASQELTHEIVDDHTARVTVLIEYGDEPVTAQCRAQAWAADKTVVGEVSFTPDPDERQHTVEIRTERRATTVNWIGCTAAGQPRPR